MTRAENQSDSDITDAELLHRVANLQDRSALMQLVEKHSSLVMAVCYQILGNQTDAEDAFQNTIVKLVSHAQQIDQPRYVSTWLYRVAQRESLNLRRRQKREKTQPLLEETIVSDSGEIANEKLQELTVLHEELDQLPVKLRGPMILCYLEGKSRQQAARELDVTLNSVKASLESGRRKLKQRLLQRGIALTSVLAVWKASQASAGTVVSNALVQSAVNSSLTQTTATSTTSISTSVASSNGAIAKGTTWMAISTGKKMTIGLLSAVMFLGGTAAIVNFNMGLGVENEAENEMTQEVLSQDLIDLAAKIKEQEKLYQNIEIQEFTEMDYFGDEKHPMPGGPVELYKPIEIEPIPFISDPTEYKGSKVISRNIQKQHVFQEGLFRLEQTTEEIRSVILMESEGDEKKWTQWYESSKLKVSSSYDGKNESRLSNGKFRTTEVTESRQFDMNPYHLFLDNRQQGLVAFSDLLSGQSTVTMSRGKSDEYLYHFEPEILERTDMKGEPTLVVLIELTRHYLKDENKLEKTETKPIWFKVFLSINRNYMPIRFEQIRFLLESEPDVVYQVLSWHELGQGLWYPETIKINRYSTTTGKGIYERKSAYEVLSLDPQNPRSYYQIDPPEEPASTPDTSQEAD